MLMAILGSSVPTDGTVEAAPNPFLTFASARFADEPGLPSTPAGDITNVTFTLSQGQATTVVQMVVAESPFSTNWLLGQTGLVVEYDTNDDGLTDVDVALANIDGVVGARVRDPQGRQICVGTYEWTPARNEYTVGFATTCLGFTPPTRATARVAATFFYEDVATGTLTVDEAPNGFWSEVLLEYIPIPTLPSPPPQPPYRGLSRPMLPGADCTPTTAGPPGVTVDGFTPVDPIRIVDSRLVSSTESCWFASFGRLRAMNFMPVDIGGHAGIPLRATGVVLNITVTEALAPGFLTVHPCDQAQPTASNLNYRAGTTVANTVFARLGDGGLLCIFSQSETHLVVDLVGYFTAPSGFTALNPARLLDSRGTSGNATILPTGRVTEVAVAGRGGVPAEASAAVLNVTVDRTGGSGFVTVYPCGEARPTASNLNFVAGDIVPNAVVTKIGANGSVCLYNSAPTHLVVDVNGYYGANARYRSMVPGRLLDTRDDGSTIDGANRATGVVRAGSVVELSVAGRAGVPASATSAMLNVTATESEADGFVTVFPCGSARPTASSLNLRTGSTVPNAVLAKIGDGGRVCLFTSSTTHLVVDVSGFTPGA
jgi:hypothetical protein